MDRTIFHGLNANTLVLVIADVCTFLFAFILSVLSLSLLDGNLHLKLTHLHPFIQFQIIALPLHLIFLAVGLYNEKLREGFVGIAIRILVAISLHYCLLSFVEYAFPNVFYSFALNEILAFLLFSTLLLSRFLIIKFKLNQFFRRNILIIGTGEKAQIIESYLRRESDYIGLNVIGYWPTEESAQEQIKSEKILYTPESLNLFVSENKIDEIVVAADENKEDFPFEDLFKLKQKGIDITDILDFIEIETGQVVVDHIDPSWFIYQKRQKNRMRSFFYWLFNASIAIFVALITMPIMLFTAICIKVEGGIRFPILYSQERIGLDGKAFSIFKFTSMQTNAEENGAQWAQEDDPRVTKVGRVIRKFRIDELPQLYNVIVGDMFFVGPRPERPQFTEDFHDSIPFYDQRHNVKPGLTGWAQLKYPYGSSEKDALEKLKFDLYYVKKRNVFLDLLILLKTSEIIIFGKGR